MEMLVGAVPGHKANVTPLAGVRIEIMTCLRRYARLLSLPSWERGLKSLHGSFSDAAYLSLPSRERGLKYFFPTVCKCIPNIVPYMMLGNFYRQEKLYTEIKKWCYS